ncbi:hypothetical protein J4219_01835 [Candidatus Woesearchaeota archaeon]|nr:hypothetical protein [Candidatus Woesearchaeota archaeon]
MPELPPPPSKAPEPRQPAEPSSDANEQLNLVRARQRVGEERYSELRKKLLLIENNMLANQKRSLNDVKSLQTDLNELKRTIQAAEDKIITIIKELRLTARREDIDVLKRYLELWDPVRFVSVDQVEKIIDEKLGGHEEEHHETKDTSLVKKPNYDSPS